MDIFKVIWRLLVLLLLLKLQWDQKNLQPQAIIPSLAVVRAVTLVTGELQPYLQVGVSLEGNPYLQLSNACGQPVLQIIALPNGECLIRKAN